MAKRKVLDTKGELGELIQQNPLEQLHKEVAELKTQLATTRSEIMRRMRMGFAAMNKLISARMPWEED
jgi:hypothetical protein